MTLKVKMFFAALFILYSVSAFSAVYAEKCETKHFKISYSNWENEKINSVANSLEKNYNSILAHLNLQNIDLNLNLNIYSSLKDFHDAIGWNDAPDWIRGRFQDELIEIVVENPDTERAVALITHEMTHIVTRYINSGFIPMVLFEGIATYEADQSYLKNQLKDLDSVISLEELFSINYSNKFSYPLAYSFTEFIIKNYGYEKILQLLKVNYQNNEFDLDSIKEIYFRWINTLPSK